MGGLVGGIGLAALITTLIGQAGVDLSATPLVDHYQNTKNMLVSYSQNAQGFF